MRTASLVITFFTIAIGSLSSDLVAQALAPHFPPTEQLVVLKNGGIIRGQITRSSEQIVVETKQGSQLVLPADETDFVCGTMNEAYWGKAARTRATDTAGQKSLFHWCLNHGLLAEAQNQIAVLSESTIKSTELEFLDRQLGVALMQQASQAQANANVAPHSQLATNNGDPAPNLAPPFRPTQIQLTPQPLVLSPIELDRSIGSGNFEISQVDVSAFRPLPLMDQPVPSDELAMLTPLPENGGSGDRDPAAGFSTGSQELETWQSPAATVRQVGFEEAIEYETISPFKRQLSPPTTNATLPPPTVENDDRVMTSIVELEKEIRELPRGALRDYRQHVERVLVMGCSAAQCHDSNSQTLPLLHAGRSQPVSVRQSQRNLHNALKYIDRGDPLSSPLLTALANPHAGSQQGMHLPGSPEFEQIKNWVITLSDHPNANFDQPAMPLGSESFGAVPLSTGQDNRIPPVIPVKPEPAGLHPIGDSPVQLPETIGDIPNIESTRSGFVPVDPFDPEIFNRKYRKF